MSEEGRPAGRRAQHTRRKLLQRIEHRLELPMIALSFVWLVLLVFDLTRGLPPPLQIVYDAIWIAFVVQFAVEFILAPRKLAYLRGNLLTALSLLVPALRIFRIARALRVLQVARAARGIRLFRVVSTLNRGMRALAHTSRRRGFGYVAALTALVLFAGAAGMFAFERNPGGRGLNTYGEALWWTAMLLTTVGSEYWPQTLEGRLLCLLLSFYALGVLGYLTATLASFFVGRDAASEQGELPSERSVRRLHEDIVALRTEVAALAQHRKSNEGGG